MVGKERKLVHEARTSNPDGEIKNTYEKHIDLVALQVQNAVACWGVSNVLGEEHRC